MNNSAGFEISDDEFDLEEQIIDAMEDAGQDIAGRRESLAAKRAAVKAVPKAANDSEEVVEQDTDLITIAAASPVAQFASELAQASQIPRNTTFLSVLSVFSALCSRAAAVSYEFETGKQPTSLYFCGEQPPATAKSRILGAAQAPIFNAVNEHREQLLSEAKGLKLAIEEGEATDADQERLDKIVVEIAALPQFITDTTPEALDMALEAARGFFSIASAEQAAVNTLLGLSYKQDGQSNKDLVLKGYNGEYHCAMRRGRSGYSGKVVGAVCVIAQEGVIGNILSASGNTGITERMILWSEGHLLGQRNFTVRHRQDPESIDAYFDAVDAVYSCVNIGLKFDELKVLHISALAWDRINQLRQSFEPTIANGGENSATILRGIIGKVDILIMKLASVLHLSIAPKEAVIDNARVKEAIEIAKAYIKHLKGLMSSSTIEAFSTQEQAILDYMAHGKPCSGKAIADKLRKNKAFLDNGKSSRDRVRAVIEELVAKGVIVQTNAHQRVPSIDHKAFKLR